MRTWPAGIGREIHEALDSTNAEALRRAAAGEAGPLWIMARSQTAARGRRGRAWAAPAGNFGATLLMRPPGDAALRSFVAALGLFDAMVAVTGRPELFALKWPNDVLLGGRKLAGILLEAVNGGALAVGIGVNLASAPEPDDARGGRGAAGLAARGDRARGRRPRTSSTCSRRRSPPGRTGWPTRASRRCATAWLARATRLGEPIVARLPGRDARRAASRPWTRRGALVLATDAGRVVLPAADITFAGSADAARH